MADLILQDFVNREILDHITPDEQEWLLSIFSQFGGRYPTLEEIWELMDECWCELGCDPAAMDERIDHFYEHPVWLLNGLFIDQHNLSSANRRAFTDWVVRQAPQRVADYGGGYGSLARMIGEALPNTAVEVIEPHPHPAAIALSEKTPNVRYRPELTDKYDVLLATDVFEHVPDPLALAIEGANHITAGGHYLIANCFHPVILCHLPQTFHFRYSWNTALKAMGLQPGERVRYGQDFIRGEKPLNLTASRAIEKRSRILFPWIQRVPARLRHRLVNTFFSP